MKKFSNKIIILRGNSGSGKSTVAKVLRERSVTPNKVALIGQDYLRRIVLKEKEMEGSNNIGLIKTVTEYALLHGYDVILEGILYSGRYSRMIRRLLNKTPNHFVYYFDISLEETIKRHSTKPDSHEFGEKELRGWYKDKDLLGVEGEIIIEETSSFQNTVDRMLKETGLS